MGCPVGAVELRSLEGARHFGDVTMRGRRLPHSCPEGRWLFVTWCLHGSLNTGQFAPAHVRTAGKSFACMDRYLDGARSGPAHLRQPEIAGMVVDCMHTGAAMGHYELGAYCVMANHVHALMRPMIPFSRAMK